MSSTSLGFNTSVGMVLSVLEELYKSILPLPENIKKKVIRFGNCLWALKAQSAP
jgi:hypothetical protein